MNLGFMHEVDRRKMTKTWLTALIGAVGLWLSSASVSAQDMSFDLNEADSLRASRGEGKRRPRHAAAGEAAGRPSRR